MLSYFYLWKIARKCVEVKGKISSCGHPTLSLSFVCLLVMGRLVWARGPSHTPQGRHDGSGFPVEYWEMWVFRHLLKIVFVIFLEEEQSLKGLKVEPRWWSSALLIHLPGCQRCASTRQTQTDHTQVYPHSPQEISFLCGPLCFKIIMNLWGRTMMA